MDAMLFRLKRAYQAPLNLLNRWLGKFGLTCARYDLMHLLRRGYGMMQGALWRMLGVSRQTVSVMLQSLVRLKLVEGPLAEGCKRKRFIKLTKLGQRVFDRAQGDYTLQRTTDLAMEMAVDDRCFWFESEFYRLFQQLDSTLNNIRLTFGDYATLFYEWGNAH